MYSTLFLVYVMKSDFLSWQLLFAGGRSQLSVTIVDVGSTPQPSPLSDRSSQQLLETPLDSGVCSVTSFTVSLNEVRETNGGAPTATDAANKSGQIPGYVV